MKGVSNHRIDDESLKEYFYRGQDYNNKVVLHTIAGDSYEECTCAEIAEKLENIYPNNIAWSTWKLDTGRNTNLVLATYNSTIDEILEEMVQIRTELG